MQTELYVKHKKRNSNKKASFARYVEHAVNFRPAILTLLKASFACPVDCMYYVLSVMCF